MFWRIFELIIRILYFRRFRSAKKIGAAGKLLGDGNPKEALSLLEKTGATLHHSLLPLYAFTRGKILNALDKPSEAEEAFKLVILSDPNNAKADLELAILSGRRFDFEECAKWLDRLDNKDDEELKDQSVKIRQLMTSITSGEREKEFQSRALLMAQKIMGTDGESPGALPDMTIIDKWIKRDPRSAKHELDEIALLVGQTMVNDGGSWKISLSIEESLVVLADGSKLNPFEMIAKLVQERHG